jgi:D-3-phosphoglycerate dehydrogenase
MGRQLKGATVGIMGYGAIARHLAPICVALGMTVLIADPYASVDDQTLRHVPLDTLLAESDFVICLVIANEETENLMNATSFARMKTSAYFLNLSRGNLIDEAALKRALDTRQIAGAAMDVGRAFDQKPSLDLARRADVIATPHTAGLTPDAIEHQAFDTVRQVGELLSGRIPKEAVNAAQATRLTRLGINHLA